jgi:hypothetical protein
VRYAVYAVQCTNVCDVFCLRTRVPFWLPVLYVQCQAVWHRSVVLCSVCSAKLCFGHRASLCRSPVLSFLSLHCSALFCSDCLHFTFNVNLLLPSTIGKNYVIAKDRLEYEVHIAFEVKPNGQQSYIVDVLVDGEYMQCNQYRNPKPTTPDGMHIASFKGWADTAANTLTRPRFRMTEMAEPAASGGRAVTADVGTIGIEVRLFEATTTGEIVTFASGAKVKAAPIVAKGEVDKKSLKGGASLGSDSGSSIAYQGTGTANCHNLLLSFCLLLTNCLLSIDSCCISCNLHHVTLHRRGIRKTREDPGGAYCSSADNATDGVRPAGNNDVVYGLGSM